MLGPSAHTDTFTRDNLPLENYREAIADFGRAMELNSTKGEAYFSRGVCYFELGDFKRAKREFQKSLQFKPSPEFSKWAEKYIEVCEKFGA